VGKVAMSTRPTKLYFVQHGPNRTHLHDCERFELLREARAFYDVVPTSRACRLTSQEYPDKWTPGQNERVIEERLEPSV